MRTTRFQYPGWLGRTGTVSIQRINTGDSVDDLMFMIWGKIPGPERKDSLRSVVIFGGPALDSISTINFSTLKCAQLGPFAALDLCFGTNLIEPANREFNRRTSWILLPVDEPDEPERKFEQPAAVAWNVKVFPNPVATSAQIEGHPVPPGDYQVEVIAVDGSAADRRRITVGESGSFYDILDLESLPSGFYVIRLYSMTAGPDGRRLVGSYPIVKTR